MAKANVKAGLFGGAPVDQPDDDKLHELYWNRAQLKQQFADKEQENLRLRKLIEEQEGSTARIEQKLTHLESLLLDPDWVHNVVVFYQLRRLNARCCAKVAKFAEQLKLQREERRHKQLLVKWNEERKAEASAADQALRRHRMEQKALEDQAAAEQLNMNSMNGLSKLLRGKQSSVVLEELEAELVVARERETELVAAFEAIRDREAPSPPGLDVLAKRSINFMILAFAQDILLRFSDSNFAAMVRESNEKSAGAIKYGTPQDCGKLLRQVQEESRRIDDLAESPDVLKHRARRIAEHADFASEEDAVPVAGTVAAIFAFDGAGGVTTTDVNILGQDYWQLSRVVSR